MKRSVCYRHTDGVSEIAILTNGVMEHYYRLQDGFLTGAIVVGKVRCVKKQAGVFVELGLEKDGLLPYRDGLKTGDYVLCQVTKEPTEEKGCALTEKLTIAGRFVVLNDVGECKFSRAIAEDRKIALFGAPKKDEIGYIFRSSCVDADDETVFAECRALIERYERLKKEAKTTRKIVFLWRDDGESVAKRFARTEEEFTSDFSEAAEQTALLGARKIETQGVELVFDKTEAMTVVDVNFHRYDGKGKDVEDACLEADKIAMKELCRQLRLRNIGGIVMVDFISLKREESVRELMAFLEEELKKDNVKTNVELVKSVGVFAIVRTKRYASL